MGTVIRIRNNAKSFHYSYSVPKINLKIALNILVRSESLTIIDKLTCDTMLCLIPQIS